MLQIFKRTVGIAPYTCDKWEAKVSNKLFANWMIRSPNAQSTKTEKVGWEEKKHIFALSTHTLSYIDVA